MSGENRDPVDMVLHTLRTTEPDPEMPSRILAALLREEISCGKTQNRWRSSWFWLTGFGLATAMILSLIAVHGASHVPAGFRPSQTARAAFRDWPKPESRSSLNMVAPLLMPKSTTVPAPGHGVARMLSARRQTHVQLSPNAADLTLESFPAPPMPLTRQERLLLRMLRGGEAGELMATLSDPARNATDRADREQYNYFFYDAPIQPQPDLAPAITAPSATLTTQAQGTNQPTTMEEK